MVGSTRAAMSIISSGRLPLTPFMLESFTAASGRWVGDGVRALGCLSQVHGGIPTKAPARSHSKACMSVRRWQTAGCREAAGPAGLGKQREHFTAAYAGKQGFRKVDHSFAYELKFTSRTHRTPACCIRTTYKVIMDYVGNINILQIPSVTSRPGPLWISAINYSWWLKNQCGLINT